MASAASFPPLHKTQGRGAHSLGSAKRETEAESVGHPPQNNLAVVLLARAHPPAKNAERVGQPS